MTTTIKRFAATLFSISILFTSCKKENLMQSTNAVTSLQADDAKNSKPNIVIFLADDIGYEIPTVDGGQSYETTNIDRIGKAGTNFTQCFGSALCSPSRFMLLTGKYNFRNYISWGKLDPSEHTIGNICKNAGYTTCYVGKWQLDGGSASAAAFGFDKYSLWLPYYMDHEEDGGSKYKDPPIYENGAFLPPAQTAGKYSMDIFTDYALNFLDSNTSRPFLLYYSSTLCHKPFTPTPDDPEYATWDFRRNDNRFFTSMVKYMDKQVGIVRNKIKSLNLTRNTIFIFVGDNGTPHEISSNFDGYVIQGDKSNTTTYGTHVPLLISWPSHTPVSAANNELVDFTDFMPMIADAVGTTVPASYGTIDGVSFYPLLTADNQPTRDYIFNHYHPLQSANSNIFKRYVQDSIYKQYENGPFYNMATDIKELSPIKASQMTPQEKQRQAYFNQLMLQMHN